MKINEILSFASYPSFGIRLKNSTVFISARNTLASCLIKNLSSCTCYITTLLAASAYIIIPESSKGTLFNSRARALAAIINNFRLQANNFLTILLAFTTCRI